MAKKERIAVVSYQIIIKQPNQIYCKQRHHISYKIWSLAKTKGNDENMMKKKLDSLRYYKSANQKDKSSGVSQAQKDARATNEMIHVRCMCVSQKIDILHRYVVFAQTSALAECAAPWNRVLHTKSIINSLRFVASISNVYIHTVWRAKMEKDFCKEFLRVLLTCICEKIDIFSRFYLIFLLLSVSDTRISKEFQKISIWKFLFMK